MIITSKDKIDINSDFKVEAGPGAGKTEFLVNHIKNILQNSDLLYRTRKVACITYTNTAVNTIKERLGSNSSDRVEVSTIHSFLYRNIIKPYCSFLSKEYELDSSKVKGHNDFYLNNKFINEWLELKEFAVLKYPNTKRQLQKLQALNRALRNWLDSVKCVYKNGTVYYEGDNRKAIGYDEKNDKRIINSKNLEILSSNLIELKKIYWREGKLAHCDVLYFSYLLIVEYPFIIEVLRSKFPYFFIDEYQDTNPIQNYILNEIRKKDCIVGVIGDKVQSIYSFQGAEPQLFDSFEVESNCSHIIKDNHRSTTQIVKLLNDIRKDIEQKCNDNADNGEVVILVGDPKQAYTFAKNICGTEEVISLSRHNVTSNFMKKEEEFHLADSSIIEHYKRIESNSKRKKYIWQLMKAIELAVNGKYKEAFNDLEWIFENERNPKEAAIISVMILLNEYHHFCDGSLMEFYNTIVTYLNISLSGFKKGKIKEYYEKTTYKALAVCVNVVDDISNHLTIHKAKGAEYKNVIVIENKKLLEFLLESDLDTNEEHRVNYVALSRAEKRLFIQISKMDKKREIRIKNKYPYITIKRL